MTKPVPPSYDFLAPFCDAGVKAQIPLTTTIPGRASLEKGFPTETQLPMSQGGVAPNRTDVNGMLWALSAFAYWQQSGGMFSWKATLNYAKPAVVFHGDKLWWCLAENGPGNAAGVVEPGTNEAVWQEFFLAMAGQIGGGGGDISVMFGGNPVGTVIAYYGTTAPAGYLACDGGPFSVSDYPRLYAVLGQALTPDLRGYFIRGLGGSAGELGAAQQDAGRDISGQFGFESLSAGYTGTPVLTGPFSSKFDGSRSHIDSRVAGTNQLVTFDVKRSWGADHVSGEFRPLNKALLYCIKHD